MIQKINFPNRYFFTHRKNIIMDGNHPTDLLFLKKGSSGVKMALLAQAILCNKISLRRH